MLSNTKDLTSGERNLDLFRYAFSGCVLTGGGSTNRFGSTTGIKRPLINASAASSISGRIVSSQCSAAEMLLRELIK